MDAAVRCGRSELTKTLFDVSASDLARYINMIRSCSTEKNLAGAKAVFEAAKSSGAQLNNFVYNALLDACVECQNLKAAKTSWLRRGRQAWSTSFPSTH